MTGLFDLPVEILETIFIYAFPWIENCVNSMRVCKQWRSVMLRRLSRVKYLLKDDASISPDKFLVYNIIKRDVKKVHSSGKYICSKYFSDNYSISTQSRTVLWRQIDFCPNLKVCGIGVWDFKSLEYLSDKKSQLVGLTLNSRHFLYYDAKLELNISSIAINHLSSAMFKSVCKKLGFPDQLWISSAYFPSDQFCCTRRLHIHDFVTFDLGAKIFADKLEILEINLKNVDYFEKILLLCPNLKSLYLYFNDFDVKKFHHDKIIKHEVENLVIEFNNGSIFQYNLSDSTDSDEHIFLEKFALMFPNLRNLAVKYFSTISNSSITFALSKLPKLEYLRIVIFEPPVSPINVADLERSYQSHHKRAISITVDHTKRTNFNLHEAEYIFHQVKEGYNFMNNIFPFDFEYLPKFLVD